MDSVASAVDAGVEVDGNEDSPKLAPARRANWKNALRVSFSDWLLAIACL